MCGSLNFHCHITPWLSLPAGSRWPQMQSSGDKDSRWVWEVCVFMHGHSSKFLAEKINTGCHKSCHAGHPRQPAVDAKLPTAACAGRQLWLKRWVGCWHFEEGCMCQSSCDNPRSSFMEWSRTHNQALSLVPTHFKTILPIPRNHQNHPSDSLDWAPALKGMPIIKDLFVHLYVCWMEVYHIGYSAHMIQKEALDPWN